MNFADTLFPGSEAVDQGVDESWRVGEVTLDELTSNEDSQFINKKSARYYINKFDNKKAAGMDRVRPIILKNLSEKALDRLVIILRASFVLSYTPSEWQMARVALVPKKDKDDYNSPKSFRPISITSFIFKVLEKMVKGEIENIYL